MTAEPVVPDDSSARPPETSWRERSRSDNDIVMEEVDAFGVLTGRTRLNQSGRAYVNPRRRPDNYFPLPSDPPITILRAQVPWWKVIALTAGMVVAGQVAVELIK